MGSHLKGDNHRCFINCSQHKSNQRRKLLRVQTVV